VKISTAPPNPTISPAAADIDPLARGVGLLLSETGIPRRIKAAYLTDDDIKYLAAYAARLRSQAAA
jgi:S-DNA-T family DNA segregation ATPase FtsK/SpoIIIE